MGLKSSVSYLRQINIKMVALAVLLLMPGTGQAGQWWTDSVLTNSLLITSNALMIADWGQTRYIADHPEKFHEEGLAENFIGTHPTTGEVNRYFVASILVMNVAGTLLPEKYKDFFYIGVTIHQAGYVSNNHEIGIKLQF